MGTNAIYPLYFNIHNSYISNNDIFSIGDLGLVKAVQILEPNADTKESIEKIAEQWKPYRTAACWYLWRMLDPVPVAY